ncbi:MAG: hypothetical protein ACYC6Y_03485, partial [Thermoguttaceae bacterium]
MMICIRHILFVTTVLLTPLGALAEDGLNLAGQTPPEDPSTQGTMVGENGSVLFPDRGRGFVEESPYLVRGQSTIYRDAVARFGWWGVETQGSPSGVGEWTSLNPSAFWDVDGLTSDGTRTIDFALSGPMDETTDLHGYLYSPLLTAELDINRFLHRTPLADLEPFINSPNTPRLDGQNFNETTDHAIRVQELDAKFSGQLAENIKWHLDVWGMRKSGERQALAMNHNCSASCHVISQSQSIDWTTMEIKPGIEVNMGPVTMEYTRTMRAFEQDDEIVTRSYSGRPNHIQTGVEVPYGVVPESFTEIDKVRIGADLTEDTRFYSNAFLGNTHNRFQDADRRFWGVDMRVTDETVKSLRLTGYGKYQEQNQGMPSVYPDANLYPAGEIENYVLDNPPVNRQWTTLGIKGRWIPYEIFDRWEGLAIVSGYDYRQLERQNVTYETLGLAVDPPAVAVPAVFTQPTTVANSLHIGPE